MQNKIALISGSANLKLAEKVAQELNIKLTPVEIKTFKDGEVYCRISESIRGKNCFILQPTCKDVNRNLVELAILIDAARRSYAKSITAVIPYFGYARQDRQVKENEPISAKVAAKIIEFLGAENIISIDLHSPQIEAFFEKARVKNLTAAKLFVEYFKSFNKEEILIVAPDVGGLKRASNLAKLLNCGLAVIGKRRDKPNEVAEVMLIGNVKDKICVLIDDIIDTAGTITKAANELAKNNAKEIYICATHAVFSANALERLQKCNAKKIIVTDTIPHENLPKDIEIVSVAKIIADAISSFNEF